MTYVPTVMLLSGALDQQQPLQWYTLALSSTFAGNLILLGSIANLIVVLQAAAHGIRISFQQHAKIGIFVTCASFAVLFLWTAQGKSGMGSRGQGVQQRCGRMICVAMQLPMLGNPATQ